MRCWSVLGYAVEAATIGAWVCAYGYVVSVKEWTDGVDGGSRENSQQEIDCEACIVGQFENEGFGTAFGDVDKESSEIGEEADVECLAIEYV